MLKTFRNKLSLVDSNTTINVRLPLEDPFIFYGLPIIGQVNQSPHFALIHGSYLRFHGLKPFIGIWKVELDEVIVPSPKLESSSSQKSIPVIPTPISEEANDDDHETSDQVTTKPRRSTRVRSAPEWFGNPVLEVMLLDHDEPTNYEEAMMSPDSAKWLEAMKSEMGSMYENKVWTLVDLPDDRQAIENKWIFKKKTDIDGNVTVYKARLVAKGFRQVQGVDYDETFSPVVMLKSVQIMLAIAAFYDYEIWIS